MEVKKIDPYTFENFNKYFLEMPFDSMDEMRNLCSIEIDGKLYIICEKENGVVFVENDDGLLNPYEVELDGKAGIKSFCTGAYDYVLKREGFDTFIQKKDNLSSDVDLLAFVKDQDAEPFLEYRQFVEETFAVLIYRYQTMYNSINASSAVAYTNYHLPTHIELHKSVGNNFFAYDKVRFYYLIEDGKCYRRAYIVTDHNYHLSSLRIFDGEKLINLLNEAYGFKREIASDIKALINGENEEYNKTRKLVDLYQNYILGHK